MHLSLSLSTCSSMARGKIPEKVHTPTDDVEEDEAPTSRSPRGQLSTTCVCVDCVGFVIRCLDNG